jgi:NAD-dependent SIR2 family protein deacetylase
VTPAAASAGPLDALAELVATARSLVVLTGAGCSTGSGIPDYRDEQGAWKHPRPVLLPDFLRDARVRQRYWGRSIVGWPRFATAAPNAAHHALAALGHAGHVSALVTQNVDRLHQRAGSGSAIDLHGRLDRVECLGCRAELPRADLQLQLESLNPGWEPPAAAPGPDGDAQLADVDFGRFRVPACGRCGGILKPAVVFFGESIPAATRSAAVAAFAQADAVLVVGSSLMVYSGYALVRDAALRHVPVACIGLGRTRADDLVSLHVAADCAGALTALAARLGVSVATG